MAKQPLVDRRDMLQTAAAAIGGTLFHAVCARVQAQEGRRRADYRNLLWLQMDGGASDIDTFNHKPTRGRIQALFDGIKTPVPGVRVADCFPLIADALRYGVLFRAREAASSVHLAAMQSQLGTTRTRGTFLQQHDRRTSRSRAVYMQTPQVINADNYRNDAFLVPGSLEIVQREDGTYPQPVAFELTDGETLEEAYARIGRREALLEKLQAQRERSGVDSSPAVQRHVQDRAVAIDALRRAATNDHAVAEKDTQRYCGDTLHATGTSILRAREVVRSGIFSTVIVRLADSASYGGWDTHSGAKAHIERIGPRLDRAVAALVEDQRRGLLGDTLIVVDTEFGRSTLLDDGGGTGRNHRTTHCSLLFHPSLAGGAVVGDIDCRTGEPIAGDGVVNDKLWLDIVNEALTIPRAQRNFTLRERVPIFRATDD